PHARQIMGQGSGGWDKSDWGACCCHGRTRAVSSENVEQASVHSLAGIPYAGEYADCAGHSICSASACIKIPPGMAAVNEFVGDWRGSDKGKRSKPIIP